ncbi:hypothetical protein [Tautonia sociabilis]|uniref:Uncharacterized protein n=1 Tax=Tautonia sociabilis TaxID=2080755 RepID=A0A432MJ28_9BACT|nr:hypothetical protein [Tautonia sociabilis]RUL87372.1 hypothetical protein TsocGM_12645 [Tautonia sociabilis]
MPLPPDDDREIADASFLFDDENVPAKPDRSRPPGRSASKPSDSGEPEGGYELADSESGSEPIAVPSRPVPPLPSSIERPESRPAERRSIAPSPVDQPWNRLSEWGPTLSRIGMVLLTTAALLYLGLAPGGGMGAVAVSAIGLAIAVILSYPIAITLERPVRMTPEHALRDYFGALAHHLPHHRRMWLLLSSSGKVSRDFQSYGEFRSYWTRTLSRLKREKAGRATPVSVRIEVVKSEKSAGLEAIEVSYRLLIFLRGRESDGPIYSSQTETTLSRGPDRMWYLDDGRLPPP